MQNSLAPSTIKTYQHGLDLFGAFRKEIGLLEIWPVPLNDIIFYMCHLYKNGFSFSTVNCYLGGLSFFSKLNNFEDNTQKFVVRKMVDGIKRTRSNKDARLPITRELLSKLLTILPSVCRSQFEAKLFTSAFSLAFHGMLRIGELTVNKGDNNHTVMINDIQITDVGLEINLKSSKTDQFGKGTVVQIFRGVDKIKCPVEILTNYLKVRPLVGGPLFYHFNKQPVTRYQFSALLKKCLSVLGLADTNYKSHSFRIGMATVCAIEGYTDEEIKVLGRWKSDSYLRYIRIPM